MCSGPRDWDLLQKIRSGPRNWVYWVILSRVQPDLTPQNLKERWSPYRESSLEWCITLFETESVTGVSGIYHPTENPGAGTTMMYTKLRKDKWYMPVQCNHCDDAPCVQVCPTGASYKDSDGIVMINYDKCIGCRYCMVACPYQARRFNWFHPEVPYKDRNPLVPMREEGVVEKCTFCVHRTRTGKGKTTRCVEACPNKARTFGNLNDPDSEVSRLIKSERWWRLKDELNTGCNIYYLTRHSKKRMRWYKPLPPPQNIRGLR